jgi:ADP-ribosylglycohydrolase
MESKAYTAVLASFAADSLALGAHWIYNTNVIDKKLGRVERYVKPFISYHAAKESGEFTHYGDQMLVLLETATDSGKFDLKKFSSKWQALFKDYTGYIDKATQATLDNFAMNRDPSQSGSESDDLAGASRISPLVYCYQNEPEQMIASVRTQTAMTHNQVDVIDSAEFFARVTMAVLDGQTPCEALKAVLKANFNRPPFVEQINSGLDSVSTDTRSAITDFGQMCEIKAAFPATIHLIAKYESNLKEALVENVMAGGDSASRGMIVGMVLGAYLGMKALPVEWLTEMKQHLHIVKLLNNV